MIDAMPLWAIAPSYFESARTAGPFVPPRPRTADARGYGVVQITGSLDKDYYVWIRQQIQSLAADESIGEILLWIDSPGGTVSGCADCATAIAKAAEVKLVTGFIEDMGASGAYWLGSQCTTLACNRTAVVGSIGAFLAVADASELFKRLGIQIIVIKSGGHKGAGVDGAKLSDEQIEHLQTRVDALSRIFINDVARGRRMSLERLRDHADGRVFVGSAAKAAGLVDRIATLDELLGEARIRALPMARGEAAVGAFAELLAIETANRGYESPTWESVIAERYPKLAAEAADHEPSKILSLPKSTWRPGI